MMTAIFFNLLVNATFSMVCGMLVVGFFIWLFRVQAGPWKLFLLSLPFVKIVYDSARGVPPNSVLLSGVDPFSLPPKHQLLQIGGGFSSWGPQLNLVFSVRDLRGNEYASSIGDYLVLWLNRSFGSHIPLLILCAVLTVSSGLLLVRIVSACRFETRRRADRRRAVTVRRQSERWRSVDIYISQSFSGTPFTGGILKPYICIPQDAWDKLEAREREAVIAHEMGHIRQWDLVTTMAIQFLGDVFWFVPGYRWLSRKIDRLREVVADQWAVRSGVQPALLASALLKLQEISISNSRTVLYSAFFRETSLLKIRVQNLVGESREKRSRFGWDHLWLRSLISVWIVAAVMIATLGGNHPNAKIENPPWFQSLFKSLRWSEKD